MITPARLLCSRCRPLSLAVQKSGLTTAVQADKLLNARHNVLRSNKRQLFFEPSLKGNYDNEHARIEFESETFWNQVKMGARVMKDEVGLWKEEWKERLRQDPMLIKWDQLRPLYVFDNQEVIDEWRTACDGDWNEGFSKCSFTMSKDGHGLFSGFLDSENIPKDGKVNKTGWASCMSPEARK